MSATTPAIYPLIKDDAPVAAFFGVGADRVYPFGDVPPETPPLYATWQIVHGDPELYLDEPPDMDHWRMQFDVWGPAAQVGPAADALIAALQQHGQHVSTNPDAREPATKLYHKGFDFEFWLKR